MKTLTLFAVSLMMISTCAFAQPNVRKQNFVEQNHLKKKKKGCGCGKKTQNTPTKVTRS